MFSVTSTDDQQKSLSMYDGRCLKPKGRHRPEKEAASAKLEDWKLECSNSETDGKVKGAV